jgi:hypothetical protein
MEGSKMKKIFLMFSVALALLLIPVLSQATEMGIDASGDIVVNSGEIIVVDDGLADNARIADDATIVNDDSVIVVPVVDSPGEEEISDEETISEPADPIEVIEEPIENPIEDPIIVDPIDPIVDPIDGPIDDPVNTTPLPSTLVMLGSGLLALSGLAWRRNNKR